MIKGTKTDDDEGDKDILTVAAYREMPNTKPKQYIRSWYSIDIPYNYSPLLYATATGKIFQIFQLIFRGEFLWKNV